MSAPHGSIPSSIQERTDQWFARASAALLGQVPCRAGCSRCCIGPFPVTLIDAQTLAQGIEALPDREKTRVEQRAAEQIASMEAAYPRLTRTPLIDTWPDTEIDRLVAQYDTIPCPALADDGLCLVYAHRPLTCRSMGIPMEEGHLTVGACSVQTFVPIVRLSASLRTDEQVLAKQEGSALASYRDAFAVGGEELLLPYAFLPQMLGLKGRTDS